MRVQIPDEALTQLETLLTEEGGIQWDIGDFLVDFWEEMKRYLKKDEQREAHAELIRQFAKGTRADRTTLRDRKRMSVFFPKRARAVFPMFSYHQFRALRSAGEEHWWSWAEFAADEGWSVAQIRREISTDRNPKEVLRERIEKIETATRKVMDDEEVPQEVRTSLCLIPKIIQDTLELIT